MLFTSVFLSGLLINDFANEFFGLILGVSSSGVESLLNNSTLDSEEYSVGLCDFFYVANGVRFLGHNIANSLSRSKSCAGLFAEQQLN